MELIVITTALLALLAFDLVSIRRGSNSIERFDSPEWDRRRAWRGFSGHG